MNLLHPDAYRIDVKAALDDLIRDGARPLGRVLSAEATAALAARADEIMLGQVTYPGLFFQHDSTSGRYEDLRLRRGYEGPSLAYRKVEKLELDPLFWRLIRCELFEWIATTLLGPNITLYRAVLFNKRPQRGSATPLHQDAGDFWGIDQDPQLQIWTALDDVTEDSGCLEYVPRSHHGGRVTPLGGVIPRELSASACRQTITAKAGESVLIHNWVWHGSLANVSDRRRRAVSICYLDANTQCVRRKRSPRQFVPVFAKTDTPNASPH